MVQPVTTAGHSPPPFKKKKRLGLTGAESAPCASRLSVPAFRPDSHRHPLHAPRSREPSMKFKLGATCLIVHQNMA